jgi:putative transposase
MARTVRIECEGAVYHVMCRGDRGESVFPSEGDRETFLDTLAEACERTGFEIHSYVLMTNHYHLLLETPEANLVEGMRWFQSVYTQRANRRRGESGHLFQGRYKAVPVEAEDAGAFLRVSDYIHLNPARAGLPPARRPELRKTWALHNTLYE